MEGAGRDIFGLATSLARSALHVHRLSGQDAHARALSVLRTVVSGRPVRLPAESGAPVLRRCHLVDPSKDGALVDDVVVIFYFAPRSYTGEPAVEISSHGNPLLSLEIQRVLRHAGFQEARPGEFTQRAVLNGKMDLTQAEGINELIHSQTLGGLTLARSANLGAISGEAKRIRDTLLASLGTLEAHIDFLDDEVGVFDPRTLMAPLESLARALTRLAESYDHGLRVREGLRIALCGRPNAGKSSLYNALLRKDRAIVTDVPGTTRDVLEDRLLIRRRDFVLLDTAGIHDTDDLVESLGIARSRRAVDEADVLVLVIDGPWAVAEGPELRSFLHRAPVDFGFDPERKDVLVVLSKSDLAPTATAALRAALETTLRSSPFRCVGVVACAVPDVLGTLEDALTVLYDSLLTSAPAVELAHSAAEGSGAGVPGAATLISTRQRDIIIQARVELDAARRLLDGEDGVVFPEKVAGGLLQVRRLLEEIVGEIYVDDILGHVFSTFCIGK